MVIFAIGAVYHESLVDDLAVFYHQELISRVAAVISKGLAGSKPWPGFLSHDDERNESQSR